MKQSWRCMGVLLVTAAALTIFTGCSGKEKSGAEASAVQNGQPAASSPNEGTATVEKTELLISAAASLTDACKELQTAYESKNANVKLSFNFGASGSLEQQIEQGAPADLFLSASESYMKKLVDKQLVDANQQRSVLINELVVVVPADGGAAVQSLGDLADNKIKHVAVGEPQTVPAGSYAKEALDHAQLWDQLASKIVQGKDVRQVLTYVESGNAEAGFVYQTDAISSDKVKIAYHVDPAAYTPIEYPAGIVKATKHSKEAQDFYTFLQSKEAQDIFVKYGFSIPK